MSGQERSSVPAPLGSDVRRVVAVGVAGALITVLDATVVSVAIKAMSTEFSATLPTIQWAAGTTSMLNVVQRIGGAFGTAAFALLLKAATEPVPPGIPPPDTAVAFGDTFWWPVAVSAPMVVPTLLLRTTRTGQTAAATPTSSSRLGDEPTATPAHD